MNILVPGGCGYLGTQLSVWLLANGHRIYIMDPGWFGNLLPDNENVHLVEKIPDNINAVIYLAGLSNDSECQKHPELAYQANIETLNPFLPLAKDTRFIFLSSVAVYGNTKTPAKESEPLAPTTVYGEHKMICEELLGNSPAVILRPAGICGYSGRMRFDLTVNRMVRDAFFTQKVHVHGGSQYRPNVHIRDVIDAIIFFLSNNLRGTYNLSHENQTVYQTAKKVHLVTGCEILLEKRQDKRSYKVSSKKLERVGFRCNRRVENAAHELWVRFKSGYWREAMSDARFMNVPSL